MKRKQRANLIGVFLFVGIVMGLVPFAFTFPGNTNECNQCHTDLASLGLSTNATETVDIEVGVPFVVEFTADNGAEALAIGTDWEDNEQFLISDNLVEDGDGEDTDATEGVITTSVTFTPIAVGEFTIRAWAAANLGRAVSIDVTVNVTEGATTFTTPPPTTTTTPPPDPLIEIWTMMMYTLIPATAVILVILSVIMLRKAPKD
ncbi:MAG: hypothetical protein JSW61_07615 [Candidatus Thorarchaeota archaeon]|nr:MAG: hypothetical protein JSW61_07615 [Candidatus Thorarchaeota archaeon]